MRLNISRFDQIPVLVLGDVMLDCYLWSQVGRVSPEAPVPVAQIKSRSYVLGGAANVAANLSTLGCRVTLIGLRGEDDAGQLLAQKLVTEGITDFVVCDGKRPTITKTRVVAQGQQIFRLDEEEVAPLGDELKEELLQKFMKALHSAQAVILSDYGKGILTGDICHELISMGRRRGISVLVDPKGKDWARYRGASCITPNEAELRLAAESRLDDLGDLLRYAALVLEKEDLECLLITRGANGMALVPRGKEPVLIAAKSREVFDVTGAGDTVIATLAAGIASGFSWDQAAGIANTAAAMVVGKVGTNAIRRDELQTALNLEDVGFLHKVCSLADAQVRTQAWRAAGECIIFTNGCFDLLHAGHIKLLHKAASEGSKLIVGLNSDASVRRLKGCGRPILSQQNRASILASLECVDMVVAFEEDTPFDLIGALRPDVLVKGSDYTKETVVGHELVESWGGKVVLVQLADGLSTTSIVELIKNGLVAEEMESGQVELGNVN